MEVIGQDTQGYYQGLLGITRDYGVEFRRLCTLPSDNDCYSESMRDSESGLVALSVSRFVFVLGIAGDY